MSVEGAGAQLSVFEDCSDAEPLDSVIMHRFRCGGQDGAAHIGVGSKLAPYSRCWPAHGCRSTGSTDDRAIRQTGHGCIITREIGRQTLWRVVGAMIGILISASDSGPHLALYPRLLCREAGGPGVDFSITTDDLCLDRHGGRVEGAHPPPPLKVHPQHRTVGKPVMPSAHRCAHLATPH